MSILAEKIADPQATGAAALLPGNRFFVRSLPLEGADVPAQVALALEALSPFPTEQMLVGHIVAPDGKQALAYAAHRRRFTPEESFAWPADCQVIPEFLALCGERPTGAGIVVHRNEERLTALAWDAEHALPVAICVADLADSDPDHLAQEVLTKAGLDPATPITVVDGALTSELKETTLVLQRVAGKPFEISKSALDEADIRDVDFLEARRKKESFNLILWNLTRGALGVIVLACLLEVAAGGISWRGNLLQALNDSRRAEVAEIDADQKVAGSIEDVRNKSPLPLEMLALANAQRPATVEFQRVTCKTNSAMEIEARTTNPADISAFERALKEQPEITGVTSKDMRARDNLTTFTFTIGFKADALRKAAAAK